MLTSGRKQMDDDEMQQQQQQHGRRRKPEYAQESIRRQRSRTATIYKHLREFRDSVAVTDLGDSIETYWIQLFLFYYVLDIVSIDDRIMSIETDRSWQKSTKS